MSDRVQKRQTAAAHAAQDRRRRDPPGTTPSRCSERVTTQRAPSTPASAGASGRHHEPGPRPASTCPAQTPSRSGDESPRGGGRHHGIGKADRSTKSDRTGRGAAHHARPQGTPESHAAGHNQGTRTGAKQQRPPGAANPASAHNTQRTWAQEQVPGNTQPTHHKPQPRRAGYRRRAHTNTHTPTPQPGMAGRSRNPNPSRHSETVHPSQDWRGKWSAHTNTHTLTPKPGLAG